MVETDPFLGALLFQEVSGRWNARTGVSGCENPCPTTTSRKLKAPT